MNDERALAEALIPIVGIGASAGGIEALRSFFENMPADSGFGFIVALHLPPDRKSMLPEILSRWTRMPVTEAQDGDLVQADRVLVVPPGCVATLVDGHLQIRFSPPGSARELTPIDVLLDSLATTHADAAIGVILSGTGHDGSLGLRAIRARGGLTLAQGTDSSAPQYSGMPDSAVAAGGVDLLVPVQLMAGHILSARASRQSLEQADRTDVRVTQARLAICDIMRERLGHDFSRYKEQTFMRRVQRRMQVLKVASFEQYIGRLETDREQVLMLFRDLLISVTSFFRDAEAFATLEREVVPRLFEAKHADGAVRVWVPGCATGEEAYSLAILLREHMSRLEDAPKVQLFASDIDDTAIATARAGRYPASLLEGLSDERRARFFERSDSVFSVAREIRDLCTFSSHSLIRDPPFSRMDLISCRNLLIYLDSELQSKIIPIFHYSLVPGGTLVLGASENVTGHDALFTAVDRANRIFVRREGTGEAPRLSYAAPDGTKLRVGQMETKADPKSRWQKAVGLATRRMLERFSPAFVVVNGGGEVVHYSRHAARFPGNRRSARPPPICSRWRAPDGARFAHRPAQMHRVWPVGRTGGSRRLRRGRQRRQAGGRAALRRRRRSALSGRVRRIGCFVAQCRRGQWEGRTG